MGPWRNEARFKTSWLHYIVPQLTSFWNWAVVFLIQAYVIINPKAPTTRFIYLGILFHKKNAFHIGRLKVPERNTRARRAAIGTSFEFAGQTYIHGGRVVM